MADIFRVECDVNSGDISVINQTVYEGQDEKIAIDEGDPAPEGYAPVETQE